MQEVTGEKHPSLDLREEMASVITGRTELWKDDSLCS